MSTVEELSQRPQRNISLMTKILLGLVAVVALFMIMPSAKMNRINEARRKFTMNYPARADSTIDELFKTELVSNGEFIKLPPTNAAAVYVFSPAPGTPNAGDMISEICTPPNYYNLERKNYPKTAILFAPDPASPGWSLLAKVWIAKCLASESLTDVKRQATFLNSTTAQAIAALKAMWKEIPPQTRAKAEKILDQNRIIAKNYRSCDHIFRDWKGLTYELSGYSNFGSLVDDYLEANPELRSNRNYY